MVELEYKLLLIIVSEIDEHNDDEAVEVEVVAEVELDLEVIDEVVVNQLLILNSFFIQNKKKSFKTLLYMWSE
jgi:hypothetical protein